MKLSTFPSLQWHTLKAIQPDKQPSSPIIDAPPHWGQSSLRADTFQPASANVRSGGNPEEPFIACANYLKGLGEEKESIILREVRGRYKDCHNMLDPRPRGRMAGDVEKIKLYVEQMLISPLGESFLDLDRLDKNDSVRLKQLAAIAYTWGDTKTNLNYTIRNSHGAVDRYDVIYDDYFEVIVSDLFRTLEISKQSPEHRLLVIMIGSLKDQVLRRRDYVPTPNPAPTMVFPKTAGEMQTLMELVYDEDYYC